MTRVAKKILPRVEPAYFVGRERELERVIAAATAGENLSILAQPSSGASELLRQAYDRLFREQGEIVPFYFELKRSDEDTRAAAARFAHEFLMQAAAFRHQDTSVLAKAPSLDELSRLAAPEDAAWTDEAVEALTTGHSRGGLGFVRNCLGIPARAVSRGVRVVLLIDALEVAARYDDGDSFVGVLKANATVVPTIIAGHRRFVYERLPMPRLRLEHLAFHDAGRLCQSLVDRTGVEINDQTRDLIAVQLGGDVRATSTLFEAAADNARDLDSFESVQQVYTDEIFGGKIARHVAAAFRDALPDRLERDRILSQLAAAERSGIRSPHLERLSTAELIDIVPGSVRLSPSLCVRDWMRARADLNSGAARASVVGEALARNIRRAPTLMADMYRRLGGLDLHGLLTAFNGQDISTAAVDYARFKSELRGVDDERAIGTLRGDDARLTLPRIAFTADAAHYYPNLAEITAAGTPAVGIGFESDGKQIAIIAAEVESKLEAARDIVEFWCDRFEMLAVANGFENHRVWLIAPEGFDDEALAALAERNAYGSSRKQIELLAQVLDAAVTSGRPVEEFELVLPMGDDTEIISARAVEDVARRHGLSAKAINQVKTALVEACINATEHSKSPDGKIHQKFTVRNGKLIITVTNRGMRLADKLPVKTSADEEQRRGWGLQLMRTLMDDVEIEHTDDGSRITLVKNLAS